MDVTGIDYSPEMIRLADSAVQARTEGGSKPLPDQAYLAVISLRFQSDKKYDVTMAIGVFDYVKEPLAFLKKMRDMTEEMMITAFPARYTPQMPIRKLWLCTKGCPVYFYTTRRLTALCRVGTEGLPYHSPIRRLSGHRKTSGITLIICLPDGDANEFISQVIVLLKGAILYNRRLTLPIQRLDLSTCCSIHMLLFFYSFLLFSLSILS